MILWLEDRKESVSLYKGICENNFGLTVKMVSNEGDFYGFLKNNSKDISLIIIDIMLYGVKNLNNIDITDSDTDSGKEAGWIVIEKILRTKEKIKEPYAKIPIIILTTLDFYEEDKKRLQDLSRFSRENDLPEIKYFEKNMQRTDFADYLKSIDL
ncbi:MAG: hypothetical protein JRJ49_02700 [Deltaproteobacteria bacterium]|nr:hypothetical protein [Deltaproteobacteria bacterium]